MGMLNTDNFNKELIGRTVVIHDSKGKRVACGNLQTMKPKVLVASKWVQYPGSSWEETVTGNVLFTERSDSAGTVGVSWKLQGIDKRCPDAKGKGGVCGIHIHSGTSCADKDKVGGHHYNAKLLKDPWNQIQYGSAFSNALSTDVTCKCLTPRAGTAGHNRYMCTDGSSGWCSSEHECYASSPFLKDDWGCGCRKPNSKSTCKTVGQSILTQAEFDITTGLDFNSLVGHAVVVHDSEAARIACAVLAEEQVK
jgi:hypothetical protein